MKFSRQGIIGAFIIGVVVIAGLVAAWYFGRPEPGPRGDLIFWSTESEEIWKPIIEDLKKQVPGIKITYVQKAESTFRAELIEAQANLAGPDLWVMPANLLRRDKEKILAIPATVLDPRTFQDIFVDVAGQQAVFDGAVWGYPISISTLAIYSNTDLLNSAGIIRPPSDWNEFKESAKFLTQRDERGKIEQAGAALGLASNIRFAPEIFLSLLWQQGGEVIGPDGRAALASSFELKLERVVPAEVAATFMAEFSNPALSHGGWLATFQESEDEFARERVAMIFGDEKTQVRLKEKNPRINFRITPFPQLRDSNIKIVHGSTKVIAVSRISRNPSAAWTYIQALTQPQNLQPYLDATTSLSPRRDLLTFQRSNERLRTFADQMLYARSWPDPDPMRTRPVFESLVEAVGLGRQTSFQAVSQAHQKLDFIVSPR